MYNQDAALAAVQQARQTIRQVMPYHKGEDVWYLAGGINPVGVQGAYVPYGAANLAAGLVNLDNPGVNNLVGWGADPTHAGATGFTFNGTTQYLQIGSTIFLDAPTSVLMRVANLVAGNGHLMGVNGGLDGIYDIKEAAGVLTFTNGTTINGTFAGTTGVAIAGTKAYRNGAALAGTFTPVLGPLPDLPFVGCWSDGGSPLAFDAFDLLWMVVYEVTLTPAQVAAVYAAAPV